MKFNSATVGGAQYRTKTLKRIEELSCRPASPSVVGIVAERSVWTNQMRAWGVNTLGVGVGVRDCHP